MKKEIKKAYSKILAVCNEYVEKDYLSDFDFEDIRNMRDFAKNHLLLIDWYEKYGLDIKHSVKIDQRTYVKIDDYRYFSYFKDAKVEKESGSGRYISWSDDDRQPKDEWLLCIGFSTGAYIFGDDYPAKLFQEFFQELKDYNPKFTDSSNKCLYFSMDKANKIFNEFPKILNKYYDKNKEDLKERRIDKLQKELEKLKTTTPITK